MITPTYSSWREAVRKVRRAPATVIQSRVTISLLRIMTRPRSRQTTTDRRGNKSKKLSRFEKDPKTRLFSFPVGPRAEPERCDRTCAFLRRDGIQRSLVSFLPWLLPEESFHFSGYVHSRTSLRWYTESAFFNALYLYEKGTLFSLVNVSRSLFLGLSYLFRLSYRF